MIKRYTLPEMEKIWSDENKFSKWLEIEILACEALAHLGQIPKDAVKTIKAKAAFDIQRIDEIERTTHHDVIAFLTNVAEYVGPDSRYIHLGLTSSDLLDTTLACLLKEAGGCILEKLELLKAAVKAKAHIHKKTVMIGRTHGVHAEPITLGFKLAVWYDELARRETNLKHAIDIVSYGKISGAVGTYAHISHKVEPSVMKALGLKPAPVSTQIIQRDRHAEFLTSLALLASSLEKMALEIRNLQRTEVLEVEEYFQKGQKGSSAMPHKRNPIICERICGMARLVRANALVGMENMPLWHERDISHSSVERVILPDSTTAVHYMLDRFTWLMANLLVYPETMMANLEKTNGLVFSQKLMLELTNSGILREEAYELVQKAAMNTWETGESFESSVRDDERIVSCLGEEKLAGVFDLDTLLSQIDVIFNRVFS